MIRNTRRLLIRLSRSISIELVQMTNKHEDTLYQIECSLDETQQYRSKKRLPGNYWCINQTWRLLKEIGSLIGVEIEDSDIAAAHKLFHTDSPTLAGGTALYVSKNLKAIPRPGLRIDLALVESCWVVLSPCNNKKHITIGCVYKHPSANLEEFKLKFEELP